MTHQLLDAVHTRACTGIKTNAHNSVTVQNRTHVYMNFFDHKNLGNHLLQLCPKVVKHPVYFVSLSVKKTPLTGERNRNSLFRNALCSATEYILHIHTLWKIIGFETRQLNRGNESIDMLSSVF